MTIPTGTILKLVAEMNWTDGEINQNVYNALISGGGGPWDEDDVLDDALDWLGAMYAELSNIMHPTLTGSRGILYKFDVIGQDWDEVGSFNWTNIPSGTNEEMPRGIAALINAKSSDPDISAKKYIPGMLEGSCSDSLWSGSPMTSFANFAVEWTTPFSGFATAADWEPAVWSVASSTSRPLTGSVVIPTIPAYQRRRKNLVGI